jgi:hypothetical protein
MAGDDAQEPLQPFSPALDDLVGESVREDLSWERRDVDPCGFVLQDIAEGFEVGVAPSYYGMAELEGGNVCLRGTIEE